MKVTYAKLYLIFISSAWVFGTFAKILDYILPFKILGFIKIFELSGFAVIFLYHFKRPVKIIAISRLFLLYSPVFLIIGLIRLNELSYSIVPNLYVLLLPIFGISFGIQNSCEIKSLVFHGMFKYTFLIISLGAIVYLYLNQIGVISYWGFGTELHHLGIYFISSGKVVPGIVIGLFLLLLGKRSTIMNFLIGTFLALKVNGFFRRNKFIVIAVSAMVIMSMSAFKIEQFSLFRRFNDTMNFDINDSRSTYIATSGRWQEVEGILRYWKEYPVTKWLGSGIGGKYLYEDYIYGYRRWQLKHYAHFSPLSYSFLFGVPFTILMVFLLRRWILKNRLSGRGSLFTVLAVVVILGSLFGSNLFVQSMPWVLLGLISKTY